MLYSVVFTEKNGRKYYKKHRAKYYLEEESTVLDSIPEDNTERMQFYYYEENTGWTFDEQAYIEYQKEIEEQGNGNVQENNSITQEEMLAAMMELAQNQSDLEDALVEVAALVGGE